MHIAHQLAQVSRYIFTGSERLKDAVEERTPKSTLGFRYFVRGSRRSYAAIQQPSWFPCN
jgi:hypothetical protein